MTHPRIIAVLFLSLGLLFYVPQIAKATEPEDNISKADRTASIMSQYFHMTCLDSFFAPSRMFSKLPQLGFQPVSGEDKDILQKSLNSSDDSEVWVANFPTGLMVLVLDRRTASCHLATDTRATPDILFGNFATIAESMNDMSSITMTKTAHEIIKEPTTISYDYTLNGRGQREDMQLGALISVNPDPDPATGRFGTVTTMYYHPAIAEE